MSRVEKIGTGDLKKRLNKKNSLTARSKKPDGTSIEIFYYIFSKVYQITVYTEIFFTATSMDINKLGCEGLKWEKYTVLGVCVARYTSTCVNENDTIKNVSL